MTECAKYKARPYSCLALYFIREINCNISSAHKMLFVSLKAKGHNKMTKLTILIRFPANILIKINLKSFLCSQEYCKCSLMLQHWGAGNKHSKIGSLLFLRFGLKPLFYSSQCSWIFQVMTHDSFFILNKTVS